MTTTLLLFAALVPGQPPQVPSLPQSPPVLDVRPEPVPPPERVRLYPGCTCGDKCDCYGTIGCRCQKPGGDQYRAAVEQCKEDGWSLLVFVGQPVRPGPAASRVIRWDEIPGAKTPCVVVGVVQKGQIYRTDLPGRPTDAEIDEAVKPGKATQAATADPDKLAALQKWLQQPRNSGRCPCSNTPDGCHCLPASSCGLGGCKNHNPQLQAKPAALPATPVIPQSFYAPPAFGNICRT